MMDKLALGANRIRRLPSLVNSDYRKPHRKKPAFTRLFGIVLLLILVSVSAADTGARVLYVAPHGDDRNPGSFSAPWQTLAKASLEAKPGDTVRFLPGTYAGVLRPANSGTADSPIRFEAVETGTARLIGTAGPDFAVHLQNVEHVEVAGFHIAPASDDGRWILVDSSRYILVEENIMENSLAGRLPFQISTSEQIIVRGNIMRRLALDQETTEHIALDIVRVSSSERILIEGNAIGRTLHTAIAFHPEGTTRYIVMRGNILHPEWGRSFEFFGSEYVLFEQNLVTGALNGSRGGPRSKLRVEQGIVRYNRFSRNWGVPVALFFDLGQEGEIRSVRFYTNRFDENRAGALYFNNRGNLHDIHLVNNLFVNNDLNVLGLPYEITGDSAPITFRANVVDSRTDEVILDGGAPLTVTAGSGQGRVLPVADARYFYDGFGIVGEAGDHIVIGASRQAAQIVRIDYDRNLLILDREVKWHDGDPVTIPWDDLEPTIDLYERGVWESESVEVPSSIFKTTTDVPVVFEAVVNWAPDPAEIRWLLHDGTSRIGRTVEVSYTSPGTYPLRFVVTDRSGRRYWTGAMVEVQPYENPAALFHTRFDQGDTDWWWLWRVHTPAPTEWELVTDPSGGSALRIKRPAASGGTSGTLPAFLHVAGWDLDRYPFLWLRYRIDPGTPLGLYVETFSAGLIQIARTAAHNERGRPALELAILIDDGQWSDLLIDLRALRRIVPDLRWLAGFGFQSSAGIPRPHDAYEIDEAFAAPEGSPLLTRPRLLLRAFEFEQESRAGWGEKKLRVEIDAPEGDSARQLTLVASGRTLYDGAAIDGLLTVNTTELPDGEHLLVATVRMESGITARDSLLISVDNYQELEDEFLPPIESPLFGRIDRVLSVEASPGWGYETGQAPVFFGDNYRRVRLTDTEEYLIWELPRLVDVAVTLYAKGTDVTGWLELAYASADSEWHVLTYDVVVDVDVRSGWHRIHVTAGVPPEASASRLRLTLSRAAPASSVQLGTVILRGARAPAAFAD